MRSWLAASSFGLVVVVAAPAAGHEPSLQECLEGGDFITHAAQARDHGMTKAAFLERLVADVHLIQAFPPELRWFVVDPDDAEFLHVEAAQVFEMPQPPETHRVLFLARCFERMASGTR